MTDAADRVAAAQKALEEAQAALARARADADAAAKAEVEAASPVEPVETRDFDKLNPRNSASPVEPASSPVEPAETAA
ncbi:MAG TPA: DUF853 domain-containing protein, partial [Terrimesophilobacter sp.]